MILTNLNSHTKRCFPIRTQCYLLRGSFVIFLARFDGKHLGTRWFGPLADVLRKYDCFPCLFPGQYQCFATNEWGTATTNSVFVRKSELNNFKDEPPRTMSVEEGAPFGVECDAPDGWPKPSVYWMLQGQNWLKTINSSRLTVDPEGKLWFSNVTRADSSLDFLYACSAASYFRNEYKLGNNGGFTPQPYHFSRAALL